MILAQQRQDYEVEKVRRGLFSMIKALHPQDSEWARLSNTERTLRFLEESDTQLSAEISALLNDPSFDSFTRSEHEILSLIQRCDADLRSVEAKIAKHVHHRSRLHEHKLDSAKYFNDFETARDEERYEDCEEHLQTIEAHLRYWADRLEKLPFTGYEKDRASLARHQARYTRAYADAEAHAAWVSS